MNRLRPGRAHRRGGFTLIELLIALSLIALITLLLFSGLRLGARAWEAVEVAADQNGELRIARGFIERALRQARGVAVPYQDRYWWGLSGDAQRIEFVAPLSDRVGIGGLHLLRLTLEERGDGRSLILTRWLLHPDVLAGAPELRIPTWAEFDAGLGGVYGDHQVEDSAAGVFGRMVLLDDVDEWTVAYFGLRDGQLDGEWFDDWFDQPTLPRRVQVSLTRSGESWPELVIPLPDVTH